MKYVIFGPGRLGRNMAAYLAHLGHRATLVSHAQAAGERDAVRALINGADAVAAAIPDGALGAWRDDWREAIGARAAIHFSGALTIADMRSAHPLYSFPQTLLDPAIMEKIAFAVEQDGPSLTELFPGAPNPSFPVAAKDRAYYHALAVLSGNFAAHLWNQTAKGFADRFAIAPEQILASYLAGIVDRFEEAPFASLTGPVARQDRATVEANLAALRSEPALEALYEAFLKSAWPEFLNKAK